MTSEDPLKKYTEELRSGAAQPAVEERSWFRRNYQTIKQVAIAVILIFLLASVGYLLYAKLTGKELPKEREALFGLLAPALAPTYDKLEAEIEAQKNQEDQRVALEKIYAWERIQMHAINSFFKSKRGGKLCLSNGGVSKCHKSSVDKPRELTDLRKH